MNHPVAALSSMATRHILADLAAAYERRSGRPVAVEPMGGVEAARLVRAGKIIDLVILASGVMEQLELEGHLLPGSRMGFARSGVAIAVPSGARQPDISDEEAVRQAALTASRICYSTGPSGDHLVQLMRRWGIGDVLAQRAVQAPPGVPVGTLLARGEADLGFQQLSELLHMPGIQVVGTLPPEIQAETVFTIGISSTSSQPAEARALASYLTSPEADMAKRHCGMEPA